MNTKTWALALSNLLPATALAAPPQGEANPARLVRLQPAPYARALKNPMKGFTAASDGSHEWATLSHAYFRWNDLENDASDGLDRILAVSNQRFAGARQHNIKFIPRVYLHWEADHEKYWPADMTADDYTSAQFQARVTRLAARLGQAWNDDPRVAFVELGIFGKWGEHHSPDPTPSMQDLVADAFETAFPDRLVSVRHVWDQFEGHGFGEYWDSFAHHQQMRGHGHEIAGVNRTDGLYLRTYVGGEAAYNWGDSQIQPGDSPTDSVTDPVHRDFVANTIRWLHCTQLRWIADYDASNAAARAGAEVLQRAMGYRFVLDEVSFGAEAANGVLSFAARVTNEGSAPFYYDWPVQLALHDPATRDVVWSSTLPNVRITDWHPGAEWTEPEWVGISSWPGFVVADGWSNEPLEWATPPRPNAIRARVRVGSVPAGEYVLSLSVVDPASGAPSLRFATANYWNGGWHPLGLVAVGQAGGGPLPGGTVFDDPAADASIRY